MTIAKAKVELKQKLRFEKRLKKRVHRINVAMINDFIKKARKVGFINNASEFVDDYEKAFHDHYIAVGEVFSTKLTRSMPKDVATTSDERKTIDEALGLYFFTRARQQALIVSNTNRKQINESVAEGFRLANEEAAEAAEEQNGEKVVHIRKLEQKSPAATISIVISITEKILSNKVFARESTIALTETQNPAEASKNTEAEVLSGVIPSVQAGDAKTSEVFKEWFTVGDEKVREAHILADFQRQPLNKFFIVDDEELRFPGDTELGASQSNTVNCRCSSQPNEDEIIQLRRKIQSEAA